MLKQWRDWTIFEVERYKTRVSLIDRVLPFHEIQGPITTSRLLCMHEKWVFAFSRNLSKPTDPSPLVS